MAMAFLSTSRVRSYTAPASDPFRQVADQLPSAWGTSAACRAEDHLHIVGGGPGGVRGRSPLRNIPDADRQPWRSPNDDVIAGCPPRSLTPAGASNAPGTAPRFQPPHCSSSGDDLPAHMPGTTFRAGEPLELSPIELIPAAPHTGNCGLMIQS